MNLKNEIEALAPALVAMRRDFHRHPELGFQETRTSTLLADHLEQLGLEVQRGIGQTGLVAELNGGQPGKTVMVRADIDALPIHETTGAVYASTNPGVMHACGHDGHAAIAAHVASVLARNREHLPGRYRFVFQPAEEIVKGAIKMLEEAPILEGVDAVVGLHLWNDKPFGWVGVRAGPVCAAPDAFTITIHGKGGHAAAPHQAVDPVVIGAHLITALQTLVSREISPFDQSVITIATLYAGEGAHNIIPERAELRGTLRTFDPKLREKLQRRIEHLATGLSSAMGGRASLEWKPGPPPVVNDAALTERFSSLARGIGREIHQADPTMGGDDMAEFLVRRPGVYFFVGSNDPSTGRDKPHHHPGFDFDDERTLPLATELLASAALEFARP